MKHMKKIFAIALAAVMLLSCVPSAFAATSETANINYEEDCSLTIYKYNWTDAYKDGVVDEDDFVSSGWQDTVVEDTFGVVAPIGSTINQVLGNGEYSSGYAIKGVEFTIANIALPLSFPATANSEYSTVHGTIPLYAFPKALAADLLTAIGLPDGKDAFDLQEYYDDPIRNEVIVEELLIHFIQSEGSR